MVAARVAVVVGAALALGACSQSTDLLLTSSSDEPRVVETAAAAPQSEIEKATAHWGKELAKSPRDRNAALNYARNLKAMDRKADALAVLQGSYVYHAQDREYLSEYGRLALEQEQVPLAVQLLERADDPAKPDWRVLSARGAAMAKQGQYKAAIPFFERARALAPNQASVMSNLALAYAMDGQAQKAEPLLRQATVGDAGEPRVRQNLALILRLQGKTDEAMRVAMGGDQPTPVPAPSTSIAAAPRPTQVSVTDAERARVNAGWITTSSVPQR
jgi:Flp pilus assembly protein TadD